MKRTPITESKIPASVTKKCMELLGYKSEDELDERLIRNYNCHLSLIEDAKAVLKELKSKPQE